MTPHDDHITADIRLRSRWSLHQKCSPFGRATSYIHKRQTVGKQSCSKDMKLLKNSVRNSI